MSAPLCLIPARGREPKLPKKNFKRIDGTPLIGHTIETACQCPSLGEVIVSTESERLAAIAREHGAAVPFLRPDALASRDTLLHEVVAHTLEKLEDGGGTIDASRPIVVLQPNVPFLRERDVEAALDAFREGANSVISVVEDRHFLWREDGGRLVPQFDERVRSDELDPHYRETGSITVTTPRLVEAGTRVSDRPGYVVTNRLAAHEVNSVLDIWMAERIATGPDIVFRVDGGDELGMGHVSRCLTLASELQKTIRCAVTFVSDPAYPSGIDAIEERGFSVVEPGDDPVAQVRSLDPDIAFFDVLDTDRAVVERLHETVAAVINLEDLAGGVDAADIVINAMYDSEHDGVNHYSGPEYFVLRSEFTMQSPSIDDQAGRVLCTFGGSDPQDLSRTALIGIERADRDVDLDYRLVLGPAYESADAVNLAELPTVREGPVEIRSDVEMGPQMAWADLAVSSGGRTVYELLATGTPTIAVAQNEREHERLQSLASAGAVVYLGQADAVGPTDISAAVERVAADRERRRRLVETSRDVVDGQGTRRILDLVERVLFG
jgi:spore coat polysaccharide biosynthesis predicted glycosyltransferase SpsG/CMP-N-acetylneuraminic acid synthetase